ncbi:MAG: response regulator [Acidobacteriota bacterium]|nr:response regulator [Acidobacteriota bacterium]
MQKTILIVEDSEICAETLRIALETMAGVQVQIASSGREALRILNESPGSVAAIVTDLEMPRMTGLDLLAVLKADPSLAGIPILLITGDSDPGLAARALRCGADSFFHKPYSPNEVRKKLEKLLT